MMLQFFLIVLIAVYSIALIKRKRYKATTMKAYYEKMWKEVKSQRISENWDYKWVDMFSNKELENTYYRKFILILRLFH